MNTMPVNNSYFICLTSLISDWLSLENTCNAEHYSVFIRIPTGLLQWTVEYYKEIKKLDDIDELLSMKIDVAGMTLDACMALSDKDSLDTIEKTESMIDKDDPHTYVSVKGILISPNSAKNLIKWILEHIHPLTFDVQSY